MAVQDVARISVLRERRRTHNRARILGLRPSLRAAPSDGQASEGQGDANDAGKSGHSLSSSKRCTKEFALDTHTKSRLRAAHRGTIRNPLSCATTAMSFTGKGASS
jgi:hypothetical protein